MEMTDIVTSNLEKMISYDEGGMLSLLEDESIGGNAGREGNYPCAGANFFYNNDTGEIVCFGNSIDRKAKNCNFATFRVEVRNIYGPLGDDGLHGLYKIVSVSCDQISDKAKNALLKSAEQYNRNFAEIPDTNLGEQKNDSRFRLLLEEINDYFSNVTKIFKYLQ